MTALSDDEIMELAGSWFYTGENQKRDDGYYYRSLGTPSNVRGSDLIEFARALLAAQPAVQQPDDRSNEPPCHACGLGYKCRSANCPNTTPDPDDWGVQQPAEDAGLLDRHGKIRGDLKASAYCVGNEYKPFHPSASHVRPEWRDGWNACFVAAIKAQGGKQ